MSINFFTGVFFLQVYLYTTCMPSAHRGLKEDLDTLELELEVAVNLHVGPVILKSSKEF